MNIRPIGLSGYGWALVSTACLGATLVFSKSALQSLSRATFLPLWFLVATLASFVYLLVSHQNRQLLSALSVWRRLISVGLLEATATFAFFLEIELIDPTLVSFFANMTTVYSVLFGYLFFKEQLNSTELVGMLMVIVGACVVTYRSGNIVLLAFLLAVFVHTLFRSFSFVVAKPLVTQIGPEALMTLRSLMLFLSSVVYALVIARDNLQIPSVSAVAMILAGALIGPFLGILLFYRTLSLLDLTKVGLIRGTMPVFVLASSFLAFGVVPWPHQIIGGVMTIAGVSILYAGRGSAGGAAVLGA